MTVRGLVGNATFLQPLDQRRSADAEQVGGLLCRESHRPRRERHGLAPVHRRDDRRQDASELVRQRRVAAVCSHEPQWLARLSALPPAAISTNLRELCEGRYTRRGLAAATGLGSPSRHVRSERLSDPRVPVVSTHPGRTISDQ